MTDAIVLDLDAAWKPYDRQARFIFGTSLFSLFLGGVGSGKSHALCCWVLARALRNPGQVGALLGRTQIDLATVLLPCLFERLEEMQEQSGVNWIVDYDKGNACIHLFGGSTIWFRPFNRISKLRGLTLTFAGVDEVEWSEAEPEEIWSVLSGRLRGQGPCPGLGFATSPNGLRGITKRFVDAQRHYMDAKASGDLGGMAAWGKYNVTAATSFDNPYLPPHFFDSLKSMSARRYRQEVEGKVLRPTHAVLSLESQHLIDWRWQAHTELPRAYGVDWGTQDHHVALLVQSLPDGRWIVADELVCDGLPRGQFQERLQGWIRGHGRTDPVAICADRAVPTENQELARAFRKTPIQWMESREEQQVTRGIEAIRDMMDPYEAEPLLLFASSLRQTFDGATAPIIPALRGYCYHLDTDGQPTSRPKKDNVHDHAIDALRYVVVGASRYPALSAGRSKVIPFRPDRPAAHYAPGHSGRQVA